jgi:hypothetical protein
MQKHIAHDEGYKYLPLEDPKDYFFTFSFDLSVFLICKEYELETIDNHEDKRLVFIFKKDDRDILDTVEEYWSNKTTVNPLEFVNVRKNLKSRIYGMRKSY